jgi:hypothetical protein
MSKPWDSIRVQPETKIFPIGVGNFQAYGAPRLWVTEFAPHGVMIRAGHEGNRPCCWQADGLRKIAEFYNELADQLEAQ